MKIFLLVLVVTLGFMRHTFAATTPIKMPSKLPTLHEIKTHTFERTYDCEGDYSKAALYLSDYSQQMKSPDLLLRGACGTERSISASLSGDDLSVISDLGPVAIESVSAAKSLNYDRVVGHENTFKESAAIKEGHTYSVLSSKHERRALFIVHVDSLHADGSMEIRYAVKSYSVQKVAGESPGFGWDQENK